MDQRNDLLAIALLFTCAIATILITLNPGGFNLKDWQPLLAALIAFGGASFVFRGATLAYNAAMAKIELDRSIQDREEQRRRRSILLRAQFSLWVIGHDSKIYADLARVDPGATIPKIEDDDWKLRTEENLDEAWENLDIFPSDTAESLADLRIEMFNFRNYVNVARAIQKGENAWLGDTSTVAKAFIEIRRHSQNVSNRAYAAHKLVGRDIDSLN